MVLGPKMKTKDFYKLSKFLVKTGNRFLNILEHVILDKLSTTFDISTLIISLMLISPLKPKHKRIKILTITIVVHGPMMKTENFKRLSVCLVRTGRKFLNILEHEVKYKLQVTFIISILRLTLIPILLLRQLLKEYNRK